MTCKFFFLFALFTTTLYCDIEDLDNTPFETSTQPLFVSLGSHCEPAHMLRYCEMRKAAFPFDWIISFDGEALIEILKDDFQAFLKDEYFSSYGSSGHLLHSYYHLEFLHDGDFNGNQFSLNLEKLKTKYQRRIERFRELNKYQGKVFFIRSAFIYSMTDPHRYFKVKENLEITDEYSLRLFAALKSRFPDLDFSLIIINNHDRDEIEEEKRLSDNLFIVRSNPNLEPSVKINVFRKFFTQLLEKHRQEIHKT